SFERDRAAFAGLPRCFAGGLGTPVRVVEHGEFGADAEHEFVRGGAEVEVRPRRWRVVLFVAEAGRALQQSPGAGRRQASPGDGVGVVDVLGQVVQAGAADDGPLLGLFCGGGHEGSSLWCSAAHESTTTSRWARVWAASSAARMSDAICAYRLLANFMRYVAASSALWASWGSLVWPHSSRATTVVLRARRVLRAVSRHPTRHLPVTVSHWCPPVRRVDRWRGLGCGGGAGCLRRQAPPAVRWGPCWPGRAGGFPRAASGPLCGRARSGRSAAPRRRRRGRGRGGRRPSWWRRRRRPRRSSRCCQRFRSPVLLEGEAGARPLPAFGAGVGPAGEGIGSARVAWEGRQFDGFPLLFTVGHHQPSSSALYPIPASHS